MADVRIETGTLYADEQNRIVSGLLLPYGEQGSTNIGKFSIAPESITIPADPDVVTLNVQHDREEPIGRATELTSTPAGIVGTFRIANTEEGNQALREIADGTRTKLSAEVKNVVIRSRKAVSGVLFGAAVVERGAFPSAALLAEWAPDTMAAEIIEAMPSPAPGVEEIVVDAAPDTIIVDEVNPDTGDVTQTNYVPETQTNNQGDNMATAQAPATVQATAVATVRDSLGEIIAQLGDAAKNGSRSLFAELAKRDDAGSVTTLFGALSDVAFDSVGSAGINTAQPQWVGELWSGRQYARKYIPLIGSGALSSLTIQAWRWTTTPTVAEWTGNKSAVPSNSPATESYEVTAQRYAGAHDWAREFRDFGRTDVIESALRAMTESYARITDDATIDALIAGATPVAATVVTEQVAWNRIIDGVEAILPTAVPTFAVVSQDLYREMLLTQNSAALEYLSATVGLESGSAAGFSILPSTALADSTVLVGAREAATSYELAGSPIRAEATDMVMGGFDIGLFGYHGVAINNAAALAIVAVD